VRPTLALSFALATAPALGGEINRPHAIDGIYVHFADAGFLIDCRSGNRVAVATEADNAALERAYLTITARAGAPLWVSLVGHVENRPRQEGAGREDVLVVDRFARVEGGRGCHAHAELDAARWKLVRLEERPVAAEGTPPFLQFKPEQGRLSGSTGCNRLNGEYRSWGAAGFTALPLATTRMACQGERGEQEVRFLGALARATHRIQAANSLELLADGLPLARFEAEYLR